MSESEKLLHSAGEQWDTVRQLVDLAPIDIETRRTVSERAEDARNILARRRGATPARRDPHAEVVEGMVGTLNELIDTPEKETTAA